MRHLVNFFGLLCLFSSLQTFAADPVAIESAVEDVIQDSPDQQIEGASAGVEANEQVVDTVITPTSASGAEVSAADVQLPIDLKAAADIALEAFGGEVVKAEETQDESGLLFTIRLVNEGRVKDVVVDAANGDIVQPLEEPLPEVTQE